VKSMEESEEKVVISQQEALNRMVRGLRDQGWQQAIRGGHWTGTCQYRAGRLKCAVGHLIPDDKYVVEMEGCPPYEALEEGAGIVVEDGVLNGKDFLVIAQSTHDGAHGRLHMHRGFSDLAKRAKLTFPEDCVAPEVTAEEYQK
jgi:hypothetical protein